MLVWRDGGLLLIERKKSPFGFAPPAGHIDEDETKQAIFYKKDDLLLLASKTEKYVRGDISQNDWEKSPGLEPVWYEWLKELKII